MLRIRGHPDGFADPGAGTGYADARNREPSRMNIGDAAERT